MADNHFKISKGLTLNPQTTEPPNPVDGDIYYDSALDKFRAYQNGSWRELAGGGSGSGINYLARTNSDNTDAEASVGEWVAYADAAAATPVDGVGGSPNITITRTETNPIRGNASYLITKDAADRQGEGISLDFSIDRADTNFDIKVSFDYEIASGTFADGDLSVFIYDITNTVLIPVTPERSIKNASGLAKFNGMFTASSSQSYRLIIHVASASTSAYTFKFDNVRVGPNDLFVVSNNSDWQSDSNPTWEGLGTVTPTYMRIRREGPDAILEFGVQAGTPSAVPLAFVLPLGLELSDSYSGASSPVGKAGVTESTIDLNVIAQPSSSNTKLFFALANSGADPFSPANGDAILSASDILRGFARVAIKGWSTGFGFSSNGGPIIDDRVKVEGGNASSHGSTNTKIRRFASVVTNIGNSITYVDSATDGGSFTVNKDGFYNITYQDFHGAAYLMGISINSNQLTTDINTITADHRFASISPGSSESGFCSTTVFLQAGSIIRAHTNGVPTNTSNSTAFQVSRVTGMVINVGNSQIGEVVSATSTATTTCDSANTYTDIAGMSITLTPGVWFLNYSVAVTNDENGGGGAIGNTAIRDGSNNVIPNTACFVQHNLIGGSGQMSWQAGVQCVPITVTSTTTYKVSGRPASGTRLNVGADSTGGVTGPLTDPEATARIWAVRIK